MKQKATDTSKKEEAEFALYDGLKNFFTKHGKKRDALVFYGAELEDSNVDKRKPEKDFVIIDLTNGNIVGIEVKYELNKSAFKKAIRQLKNTKDIFQTTYRGKIQEDWTFISIAFGIGDTNEYLCEYHRKYVLTTYDLETSLEKVLNVKKKKNSLWKKDFILMVRDLIPKKVAMPKEMVDLIANNLERASTPNSIIRFAFWTPDQYNFNTFCENNKRVIFTSSPSTGKTILMMNSALKLLKEGQRVLFLFYRKLSEVKESLLQLNIEEFFQEYIDKQTFIIKTFNEKDTWSSILGLYKSYNVFIDELIFQDEHKTDTNNAETNSAHKKINTMKKHTKSGSDPLVTRILDWHEKHDPTKHLWVAVTGTYYGFQEIDRTKFEDTFFFPEFVFVKRNSKEIIEQALTLANKQRSSRTDMEADTFLEEGDDRNITPLKVEIPSGLPRGIKPKFFHCSIDLRQPLQTDLISCLTKVISAIPKEKRVIIVLQAGNYCRRKPNTNDLSAVDDRRRLHKCQKGLIFSIIPLLKVLRGFEPFIYECDFFDLIDLKKEYPKYASAFPNLYCNRDSIKDWMSNPKKYPQDLITTMYSMRGFEHDVIVYIQFGKSSDLEDENIDDLNIVLRTTAQLIVVSISHPTMEPTDKTDYRSFMDAEEMESLCKENGIELSDVLSERELRHKKVLQESYDAKYNKKS